MIKDNSLIKNYFDNVSPFKNIQDSFLKKFVTGGILLALGMSPVILHTNPAMAMNN